MDRPFLFFDSIFLEKYFLWQIMSLDIVYDFVILAFWLILGIWSAVVAGFPPLIVLAVPSGIVFGYDLYQLLIYMFGYRYKQDSIEFDGKDLEQQ